MIEVTVKSSIVDARLGSKYALALYRKNHLEEFVEENTCQRYIWELDKTMKLL